ncbi:RNA-directed DNA polymerase, eukaryota [Tanacetum coccineum]
MKSHDYHIMMQRLLPVGVRGYLDETISRPIIELCSFLKQLCFRNLMVSDMLKAKEQLIRIMCTLEQIYPPAFFDIMIHLVIHLPEEAIQEGYVADEALTFCSMYLEDIETRFNRPDRNGDTLISDVPVTNHELSVFESVCSLIGKRTNITFNDEEYKKVERYVLNNSPEIASYMTDFSTENPPTQLRSEFPRWFKTKITCMVSADKSRCSDDLLALAHRPEVFANSYTSCTVNGVRFTVHTRDQHCSTQNSGISTDGYDGTTYYGQLEVILELIYTRGRNVMMFRYNITHTRLSRAGQSTEVDNIQASVSDDDDFIVDGVTDDIDGFESDNNQCEGDMAGMWVEMIRRPPRGGCQGSGRGKKGRSKTTLIAFRKMWEDNEKKLLPINFDSHDGETWKPKTSSRPVSGLRFRHILTRRVWCKRAVWLYEFHECIEDTAKKELQDSLKSNQERGENVPEKEVVKRVLGTRSRHTRGVDQKLKGVSSSSSATSSSSSYYGGLKAYTQDEVKGGRSDDLLQRRMELIYDIQFLDQLHAMELAQKSKIKWAIEGDENTRFFHGVLNKKRNQMAIRGVLVDGKWIDQPSEVKGEFFNHFYDRFDKPVDNRIPFETTFPKQISRDQQIELERMVTKEELKVAVWDCGTNKSPGPDGFTFGFFRHFWSILEEDQLYEAVSHFFVHGDIPPGCNPSFITLIPKVPAANMVKDFRPICLIGCIYKIIAKILANRFWKENGGIIGFNVSYIPREFYSIYGSPDEGISLYPRLDGSVIESRIFVCPKVEDEMSFQWREINSFDIRF